MKKWFVRAGIALPVMAALYVVLKLTFILAPMKIAAGSGEPTLKKGQTIWISRWKKPGKNRLVCFRHTDSMFGPVVWVFRQVAGAGDIVEIKNGIAYVNGQNADDGLRLYHLWQCGKAYANALSEAGLLKNEDAFSLSYLAKADSLYLPADESIQKVAPGARLALQQPAMPNPQIVRQWDKPWNTHFFGPVTVPPGHIFVLGDNRDFAQDSRFIGFVPLNKVVAVVLGY